MTYSFPIYSNNST